MISLETKFEDLQYYIESQFSPKEKYIVLANYLFTLLRELTRDKDDEVNKTLYFYDDLLDYNYVVEYLQHNPSDKALLLAQAAHTLLFLNSME